MPAVMNRFGQLHSDNYAPTSNDYLSNITIEPLIAPGDTKGIIMQGVAAPLSNIGIFDAVIRSPLAWGVYVQGASPATYPTNVTLFNTVEYAGGSPVAEYCMQFLQVVTAVNITNLNCSNLWAGIAVGLTAPRAFNDFTVTNSQFTNIATNGIETCGNGISPTPASRRLRATASWPILESQRSPGIHSPISEGATCTRPGGASSFRRPETPLVKIP
jgi:hypothetical protein